MIIVMRRLFLCVAMAFVVAASMAQGSWPGGTGTSEDPYLIKTVADLQALTKGVSGGAAFVNIHFRQEADIDLSSIRGGNGWTPIGTYGATGFAGIYDGNGHTISGLYVKGTQDGIGLFGYVTGGMVKNVILSLCDITGNNFVGGIVGYNNGTIDGCAVKNGMIRITGTYHNGGGIAGMIHGGTVSNCLVENTTLEGNYSSLGGITGSMSNATVSGCSVTGGSINGASHAGGIAGANEGGSLSLTKNHYTSSVKGVNGGVNGADVAKEEGAVQGKVITTIKQAAASSDRPMAVTSVSAAVPKDAAGSRSSYIVKTKGVKKPEVVVKEERPKEEPDEPEATDFMGKNFRYRSMCDWTEGMRFMVIPEKYDLLVNTFHDAENNREVSSGTLRHKIMVYKGHEELNNGRVHVNFVREDNNHRYYYELPNGTFDDYCYGKMGVPTLAYLGDVDKARELLKDKLLLTRTQFFRVDTEYDGDGYREVTVDKNKVVKVTNIGVGTRSFPVKIIVEDDEGNEFYQNVAMSKINSGMRDDEFTLDNEKFAFQGSFDLSEEGTMEVSTNVKDYINKTVHTRVPVSMSSKGSGKVRDVKVPRFTGFIIDEVNAIKGMHFYTLTLRETESRRVYYKDITFNKDEHVTDGEGRNVEFFGAVFAMGEGEARITSKETRAAIREGRVIRGMSKDEVELAMGEPAATMVDNDGNDIWLYARSNGVVLDVWFDSKGHVKQAKARKGNVNDGVSTRQKAGDGVRSTQSKSMKNGTPL
ncbi:MAG: outer membrane protein assembly factor BamE [Prevotella sp.]|nr:outer membrane protein assembly factor BamE [Prevotella sp.]